jgi:hypothetical protein
MITAVNVAVNNKGIDLGMMIASQGSKSTRFVQLSRKKNR